MTKRKKKTVFQVPAPRPSILGLDKLAAEKRKQQKEERKSRVTSYKDDADAGDDVESDVTPSRHGAAKPPRDRWAPPLITVTSTYTAHLTLNTGLSTPR